MNSDCCDFERIGGPRTDRVLYLLRDCLPDFKKRRSAFERLSFCSYVAKYGFSQIAFIDSESCPTTTATNDMKLCRSPQCLNFLVNIRFSRHDGSTLRIFCTQ